jgi:hypothetical protein
MTECSGDPDLFDLENNSTKYFIEVLTAASR